MKESKDKIVKLGIIGLGWRTEVLLVSLFAIDAVEISAICDLSDKAVAKIKSIFLKSGRPIPAAFNNYNDLLQKNDIDAVLIPTSWNSHLPIAAAAMKAGKYTAIEVGGASSTEELWQLVHASEGTGAHCMMLENCCYARNELMILNMARQGLFGELIHCCGGYEHDLRDELIPRMKEGFERTFHNKYRNCDLYPTHQLGPIAKILNINRGNRFLSLVSMASKSRGLGLYVKDHSGRESQESEIAFNKGDVVTTIIKCAGGETITLTHSVSLPRPYSRNGRVQGTRGIWLEDVDGIHIEGISSSTKEFDVSGNPYTVHHWDTVQSFYDKYDHPIWRDYKDNIVGGHGGMDCLALMAFIDAVRHKIAPPIDVYDCAAWMSVTCLSEQSIALGSMPVAVPDFTNGKWIKRESVPINKWSLTNVYKD